MKTKPVIDPKPGEIWLYGKKRLIVVELSDDYMGTFRTRWIHYRHEGSEATVSTYLENFLRHYTKYDPANVGVQKGHVFLDKDPRMTNRRLIVDDIQNGVATCYPPHAFDGKRRRGVRIKCARLANNKLFERVG